MKKNTNFFKLKDNIKFYIASKVLNLSKDSLISGFEITDEMENIAMLYLKENKPLSKIFNEKYFWNHCFYTTENTLDPRPSTESIIERILKNHDLHEEFSFLELGIGTGAICCTILSLFPKSTCTAIEISEDAIEVAKININRLSVQKRCTIIKNDWLEGVEKHFDILISNPPYLSLEEYKENFEILRYDPFISLVPPNHPLEMYEKIADKQYLFKKIYLEIPPKRKILIKNLFEKDKLELCY